MKKTPLEDWIVGRTGIDERSREKLEEYQLARIRETLEYAKARSRFYRGRLEAIKPEDIVGKASLWKIPFTFPKDLQRDPFGFLCVPQSEISRVVTLRSTGTSGTEKRIFFTEDDLEKTIEFFIYGMGGLVGKADRVLVLLPGPVYGSIGDLLKKALERIGIACFVHGVVTDIEETAGEIADKEISCLVGIPSQVLRLSREKNGLFRSRIKSVLLSTDYVPEALIRELTEECGCKVFTHYGMTEMGYGGGVECEALCGYHMREAELFFEIVDPSSGLLVPDGTPGEIVFTTLDRKAMPLIRYRTGDIASFSPSPCPCETFLKTIRRVSTRLENMIRIGENSFCLSELDELILPFREVTDYGARILDDSSLNIEIRTKDKSSFDSVSAQITKKVRNYLAEKSAFEAFPRIGVSWKNETEISKNSMTKRTLPDLRKNKAET